MDEKIAYMVVRGKRAVYYNTSVDEHLEESLREFGRMANIYDDDDVSLARVRYKPKHLLARLLHAFSIFDVQFPNGLNENQVKVLDIQILMRQEEETALSTRGYI